MNLINYIDLIKFEIKSPDIPFVYLRRKVNAARREIARTTRCLECESQCESQANTYAYQVPHSSNDDTFVDLIEILDCKHEGLLLDWINASEMRYNLQHITYGVPEEYSYFGGESQGTGKLILYPGTQNAFETIEISAIQYPLPLIHKTDVCEMPDILQEYVSELVEALILIKRWHPQGSTLLNRVNREIRQHINLKSI